MRELEIYTGRSVWRWEAGYLVFFLLVYLINVQSGFQFWIGYGECLMWFSVISFTFSMTSFLWANGYQMVSGHYFHVLPNAVQTYQKAYLTNSMLMMARILFYTALTMTLNKMAGLELLDERVIHEGTLIILYMLTAVSVVPTGYERKAAIITGGVLWTGLVIGLLCFNFRGGVTIVKVIVTAAVILILWLLCMFYHLRKVRSQWCLTGGEKE